MAKKRNLDEAMEAYKGGGGFFSLAEDKDTATRRFLVGDSLEAEVDWFVVHEVKVSGKKRYMQCTEEGDCEGCRSSKPQIKLFIQLEDPENGEITVWERGRTFISKLTSTITKNGPLYNRLYEIERNGAKGDEKTTYELYGMDPDGTCTAAQMVEKKQKLLGEKDKNGLVLNLSRDNMILALQGRYLPPIDEENSSSSGSSTSSSTRSETRTEQPRRNRSTRSDEDVF